MADRTARRDASAMTPAELVAVLTANVGNPWTPPGGGLKGALSHDVIHGLDITVPLGIRRQVPEERLRIILPDVARPNGSSTSASTCGACNYEPTTSTGPWAPVLRSTAPDSCCWRSAAAGYRPAG